MLDPAAALQVMTPRVIHQNPSHQLGRNGEEVGAVLPSHVLVVHQSQVSFVDQSGRLQAVTTALPAHVVGRQPAQFVVHDGC